MNEAALRDRVEYLEAENAELKRLLRTDPSVEFVTAAKKVFAVRPQAVRILWVLWDCKSKSKDVVFNALWGESLDPADIKSLDMLICLLRAAIKPCGAKIETIWGHGYQLSPESRAKIAAHIGIEVRP